MKKKGRGKFLNGFYFVARVFGCMAKIEEKCYPCNFTNARGVIPIRETAKKIKSIKHDFLAFLPLMSKLEFKLFGY